MVKFKQPGMKSYPKPKGKKKVEFGKKLIQKLKTDPVYRKSFFKKK